MYLNSREGGDIGLLITLVPNVYILYSLALKLSGLLLKHCFDRIGSSDHLYPEIGGGGGEDNGNKL